MKSGKKNRSEILYDNLYNKNVYKSNFSYFRLIRGLFFGLFVSFFIVYILDFVDGRHIWFKKDYYPSALFNYIYISDDIFYKKIIDDVLVLGIKDDKTILIDLKTSSFSYDDVNTSYSHFKCESIFIYDSSYIYKGCSFN